jgi:putative FmdB family regulatory protein
MPTYDYACSACNVRTEFVHGINALGPTRCPNCGSEGTMRKSFATPTFHFKGSGWAKKERHAASRAGKPEAGEGASASGEHAAAATGDGSPTTSKGAAGSSESKAKGSASSGSDESGSKDSTSGGAGSSGPSKSAD